MRKIGLQNGKSIVKLKGAHKIHQKESFFNVKHHATMKLSDKKKEGLTSTRALLALAEKG